jgi:hypothetical protein
VSGRFDTIILPGSDDLFSLTYTPTSVYLTAIPEPASAALLIGGALVVLAKRRRVRL